MTIRPSLLLPLLAAIAAIASPAAAFDPRGVDILTLRLGMHEPQVIERLDRQGYLNDRLVRHRVPCPAPAGGTCLATITARTMDGLLTIAFSANSPGAEVVTRITYTLDARKPGEPEAIESAVLDRYGPPTSASPMAWCDRTGLTGACPPDRARLSFEAGDGVSRVLTLAEAAGPAGPAR